MVGTDSEEECAEDDELGDDEPWLAMYVRDDAPATQA